MTGAELIAKERQRQMLIEGWSPAHDDSHEGGQMAVAACRYAISHVNSRFTMRRAVAKAWPWASEWFKPKDPIRNLVRAGALIAAEIDRLRRAEKEQTL